MLWALGCRPKTHIPVHTVGQQMCLWIPKMVVVETHHAEKIDVGYAVARQTRVPLHTMGQQTYFWIPKTVVFEPHRAKK